MANFSETPCYGDRFVLALQKVSEWHRFQVRKVGNVPYTSHLLTVAALVWENGGTEDEAIAALAHDSLEDVAIPLEDIQALFGKRVADIVDALSEDKTLPKSDRKAAYVNAIANSNKSVALVSACDKLHNLRGYCRNPELIKPDVVEFYCQLYPVYRDWLCPSILDPVHPLIEEMGNLISQKLLNIFSVYVSLNWEGENILKYWGDNPHDPIANPSMRVASSQNILDMAFSSDWKIMPTDLKLADGKFKKAELKARQEALRSPRDPQLEEFYSAIGRRLD